MFLLHVLVYLFFALFMSAMAKRSALYHPDTVRLDGFLKVYVAFYVLICAVRWRVGVDSVTYAKMFTFGMKEVHLGESFFYYLTKLTSDWGVHFSVGFALCAFLQIYPITKALKEYKYILIFLPLVLFGSRYFADLNNGVRQMMVASLFVYASRFIVDKKPWYYTAFILLGTTIHQSTLLLIPFYFIPNWFCMANKKWLMLGIFTFCFIAGLTPAFQRFIGHVEYLASLTGYDTYAERAASLLKQGETEEALVFGPMMLSYTLVAYAIIWFGPVLQKKYGKQIRYFNLWYNLSFLFACSYFLVCNISHLFIRPTQYFELFQMIMVALLLNYFRKSQTSWALPCFWAFLFILWTSTSWNVRKYYGREFETVTYKVFFFHMDEVRNTLH